MDSICAAARRGSSQILKAQATDPAERADVRSQLEIAGPRAAAAAGKATEWLSRRGQPLNARRLSAVVRSAVSQIPDPAALIATAPSPLAVVAAEPEPGAAELWAHLVAEMAPRIDETTLDLWVAPLQAIAFDNDHDRLVVGGEPHIVRWVESRLGLLLAELVAALPAQLRVGGVELRAVTFDRQAATA